MEYDSGEGQFILKKLPIIIFVDSLALFSSSLGSKGL